MWKRLVYDYHSYFDHQSVFMIKKSRKEKEKKARRDLIIDSALQVMKEKGFENATMDEIAEAAEMGKGTLYLYFESKTALYLAISERGARLLNQQIARILVQEATGLELIEKIGFVYLDFIRDNPLFFTAFNYFEHVVNEGKMAGTSLIDDCNTHAREAMAYIVRALQIGMQDGSIKSTIDPRMLGIIIWGASRGVMHMAFLKQQNSHLQLLDDVEYDLNTLVTGFINLLRTGMKK